MAILKPSTFLFMNLVRIWAIASNVFLEVVRERILYLIGFFTILMIAAWRLIPEVAATTEKKILLDIGIAAINILSVIVAIFVGTGLINKEIEKRTVLTLIAKPISRAEFIVGKHLGLSGVLAVLVMAMTTIYFVMLNISQIAYPPGAILVAILYLLIELSLLTAAALLFGVFTSSILATFLTFAVYLMGHLSQDILKLGKISENPEFQRVTEIFYLVLPDLSRLNLKNEAVYGLLPNQSTLLSSATYGLFYTGLLLAIAVLIFSRREF